MEPSPPNSPPPMHKDSFGQMTEGEGDQKAITSIHVIQHNILNNLLYKFDLKMNYAEKHK